MIARGEIRASLVMLDKLFQESRSNRKSLLYSKLAVIELCGWIEEEMDDLILKCSNRNLKNERNRKHVEGSIIKLNYGFEYEKHFRSMLVEIIGLKNFERIEKKIDDVVLQKFKSALSALKPIRNSVAHTHIRGATTSISAPSYTIAYFGDAEIGFREINKILKKLKL